MAEETPNMQAMLSITTLTTKAVPLVRTYEQGFVYGPESEEIPLTEGQITAMKQKFAAIRNQVNTLWDSITGEE